MSTELEKKVEEQKKAIEAREARKESRFQTFKKKLESCTDYLSVRQVNAEYRKIEKELERGDYMMTEERSKEFWAEYKKKTAEYQDAYDQSLTKAKEDYEFTINTRKNSEDLVALKEVIRKEPLFLKREDRENLLEACDTRILEFQGKAEEAVAS